MREAVLAVVWRKAVQFGCMTLLAALLAAGCTQRIDELPEIDPMRGVSRSPGRPWQPRVGEVPVAVPGEQPPGMPADLAADASRLTLAQLVDVALAESPSTRAAWQTARAAAATYGQARGAYYPSLIATAGGGYGDSPGTTTLVGGFGYVGATLDYLLLDFGGRGASVEAARQALFAASWNQNQAIQDVLLNVAQAYYAYVGAIALVRAAEASLHDAEISLSAADARLRYGAGTIADVYQARAAAAQATLVLVGARGAVSTARGVLATAVGWRADTRFDVDGIPPPPQLRDVEQTVESLIDAAQRQRPALAAARAAVLRQQAALRQAESAQWPVLNANGAVRQLGAHNDHGDADNRGTNYTAAVQVTAPIFEGFALRNAVRSARATLAATRARLELSEQEVIDDVWTAYYAFRTAAEQLDASRALLDSAKQSYDVSLERYRLGAGDVVQLLNTLSTLAGARAALVNAETALYTSYAQLLHAIGAAEPSALAAHE
jgi:outer membrane protein